MVYRIFVEKKPGLDNEARALLGDAKKFLGIKGLEKVRLLNRYDAENISEDMFSLAVREVFSEPQLDNTMTQFDAEGAAAVFAVEYLPGQFDQRADSAAQCVQFLSQGERPLVRSAKVYLLYGSLTDEEIAEIKKYVINPVEAREASMDMPETLKTEYAVPTEVATLEGFTRLDRAGLEKFVADYGLAMDVDDITFCQSWFREEGREPTITEIRMLDTYWSDHCRGKGLEALHGRACGTGQGKEARVPDGSGDRRREVPEEARKAGKAGRERRNQRLHGKDGRGAGRGERALAAAVQE